MHKISWQWLKLVEAPCIQSTTYREWMLMSVSIYIANFLTVPLCP